MKPSKSVTLPGSRQNGRAVEWLVNSEIEAHRLNMELDFQSLFGLHVLIGLVPQEELHPGAFDAHPWGLGGSSWARGGSSWGHG